MSRQLIVTQQDGYRVAAGTWEFPQGGMRDLTPECVRGYPSRVIIIKCLGEWRDSWIPVFRLGPSIELKEQLFTIQGFRDFPGD